MNDLQSTKYKESTEKKIDRLVIIDMFATMLKYLQNERKIREKVREIWILLSFLVKEEKNKRVKERGVYYSISILFNKSQRLFISIYKLYTRKIIAIDTESC